MLTHNTCICLPYKNLNDSDNYLNSKKLPLLLLRQDVC